jgi:MoaA/NifB/PqqE/SkfB family radical SAM enzyme
MSLIRHLYPDIAFCISSNGLLLSENLEQLRRLRVQFLTITVNAVDAEVGSQIYAWILWKRKKLDGQQGARLLIDKQWQGLEEAAKMGFFIKVNTVMIPRINTDQIPKIARRAEAVNVHIHNIMPIIPIRGTRFADIPSPSGKERRQMQSLCRESIPQMTHCRLCRSDVVGLLGEDRRLSFLSDGEAGPHCDGAKEDRHSIRVAVASKQEGLIDLHFGHAREVKIYQVMRDGNCTFVEKRSVKPYCDGPEECGDEKAALGRMNQTLSDCQAVFCVRIGWEPEKRLKEAGTEVITTYDRIEEAVRRWFLKKGDRDRDKETKE